MYRGLEFPWYSWHIDHRYLKPCQKKFLERWAHHQRVMSQSSNPTILLRLMVFFLVSPQDLEWWLHNLKHFWMQLAGYGEPNSLQANQLESFSALHLREVDRKQLRKFHLNTWQKPLFSWPSFSCSSKFIILDVYSMNSEILAHVFPFNMQLDCYHPACSPWNDLRAHWIHIWSWHVWNGAGEGWQPIRCRYLCWGWHQTAYWAGTKPSFPPGEVLRWHCKEIQGNHLIWASKLHSLLRNFSPMFTWSIKCTFWSIFGVTNVCFIPL